MKMRCYRFYRIPTEEERDYIEKHNDKVHVEDKYVLYAITNDKNIAKEFRNTRNMKRLYECSSKVSKEEYRIFANRNRSTVLDYYELITVVNKYEKKQKTVKVNVLMTMSEYQFVIDSVEDTGIIFGEADFCAPYMRVANPAFFNTKILRMMDYLAYKQLYYMYRSGQYIDEIDYDGGDDPDYDLPIMTIDEVEVFITQFSDLLK